MIKQTWIRAGLLIAAAAMVPACGGGSSGGGGGGGTSVSGGGGNAVGIATGVNVQGGQGAGQNTDIRSTGPVRFGVNPAPPSLPLKPVPTGVVLNSLAADFTQANGNILISGTVTGTGAAARTITASDGDIIVSGTLNSGQNAATQIALTLSAVQGTVYITGLVRTSSIDGVASGNAAGTLTINARRIVLTGSIDARGEAHATLIGGAGGAVALSTAAGVAGTDVQLLGSINTTGGTGITGGGNGGAIAITAVDEIRCHGSLIANGASLSAATGTSSAAGNAGNITLIGPAGVHLNANIQQNGGSIVSSGPGAVAGDGGNLTINATGAPSNAVDVYGSWSTRGGSAADDKSGTNVVAGGDGGDMQIGSSAVNAPASVDFATANFNCNGGSGGTIGDGAGSFDILAGTGDLIFNGTILADDGDCIIVGGGGDSDIVFTVGVAGDIYVNATITLNGADSPAGPTDAGECRITAIGDVNFKGSVTGRCGSSTASVATAVAGAGPAASPLFEVTCNSASGSATINAVVVGSGGNSTGAATAGDGETVLTVTTQRGHASITGSFTSNGGRALGTGGTGGDGGRVIVNTDSNNDGIGGDITLQAGSSITLNAGTGTTGGNAQNIAGTTFLAVSFDADGANAAPAVAHGVVQNLGSISARGAATDGDGGDITFDGQAVAGLVIPVSGTVDQNAAGAGTDGIFTGQ